MEFRDLNDIILVPTPEDESYNTTGIDMIIIPAQDPIEQWYAKLDLDGNIEFYYDYTNKTMYELVYNETDDDGDNSNQTKVLVDVIITPNTNLTNNRNRRLMNIPQPAIPISQSYYNEGTSSANQNSRDIVSRKLGIENPIDCIKAAACALCESVVRRI